MSYCNNDEWEGESQRISRTDPRKPIAQPDTIPWWAPIACIALFALAIYLILRNY